MSDGARESGSDIENNYTKKKPKSEDFVEAIAKIAVAQVCESAGFQGFQQSALNALSDVAVRYIHGIGKTANLYANISGRTEGNVFDIIQGLEDLGLPQGFSGASEINRCLADSGAVRDIIQFVDVAEQNPFAYSIPSFPVIKDRNHTPSFVQAEEILNAEHVPEWLPVFPDAGTYEQMPEESQREPDTQIDKSQQQIKEHRNLELSLLNMQQRLCNNGSHTPTDVDPGDAAKAKRAADTNPFLAAPLQFGEKEVCTVVIPPKLLNEIEVIPPKLLNETSVQVHEDGISHDMDMKTFDKPIEEIKSKESEVVEEGSKSGILQRESRVQFKIKPSKKSTVKALNLFGDDDFTETDAVVSDNVKDGKKRRAEQILEESIENTHEMA